MTNQIPIQDAVDAAVKCAQQAAACNLFDQALEMSRQALVMSPDHPGALALLSTMLARQGDVDEAIPAMERAISMDSTQAIWYANLCAFYRMAFRPDDALNAAISALRLDSTTPRFLISFAVACLDLDRTEEAVGALLRAIALESENAAAHVLLGEILLARGEMLPGWAECEWRVRVPERALYPAFPSPVWNGMRLPGSRIVVLADQGYGDCIQFGRYLRYVAERCERVLLFCNPEIAPILGTMQGVGDCFTTFEQFPFPPHAVHCRLSSLPWIFGTEVDTIPEPGPYVFADPEKVSRWRERLNQQVGPIGKGSKKVGLSWRGSPKHENDRRRSLRLSQLTPLAAAQDHGVTFVSLQKMVPENDRDAWETFRGMPDFSDQLTDFGETAALIACLDLVITVDTSIAHLAAAMGKPTWVLISKACDWRWILNRTDSPWYPSIRLFKQNQCGQWTAPIQAVADALLAESRQP
jgi:hypothetical protein